VPGWGGAAPRGGSGGGGGGREMQGAVVKEEKGRKSMDESKPDYVFEAGVSGLGYYRAQSSSYEDILEDGRLPWASQKQVEAQTYFPHKYALASAAHVTSPMPPLLSEISGGSTASGAVHGGSHT